MIGAAKAMMKSGITVDAHYAAWLTLLASNGGTASAGTKAAVLTFITAAKAHGYFSKFVRLNLFCGDQWAAASTPVVRGPGGATDVSVGTGSYGDSDYSEAEGVTARAATGLNTGVNDQSAFTAYDIHISAYGRTWTGAYATGNMDIGCYNGSNGAVAGIPVYGSVSCQIYQNGGNVFGSRAAAVAAHLLSSRRSNTDASVYQRGVSLATSGATSSNSPANLSMYVFGLNAAGTFVASGTTQKCAMYSIGSSMTDAQAADFYTDIQAFQTSLGRQV